MLDHRIVLVSLLALFLALTAVPALSPRTAAAASRLVPIEVEPETLILGQEQEP